MGLFDIILIGIALSMDAFAVSVCKGLSVPRFRIRHALCAGLWFGGFQALMPCIGYVLGYTVSACIDRFAGLLAFLLLGIFGLNMIRESREAECSPDPDMTAKAMLPAALATSIDALAVGVTFAGFGVNILQAVSVIGLLTFLISAAGVRIGSVFGARYQQKAEFAGGVILILIGVKLLAGL